eukprot:CAMPEP_0117511920 /NCGR_PEP_ID=MMETSP0784-20121206/28759_1 /TAXON_ID=39447 /ORGANISM="" /LENGTH=436 /DNA_ID=CAMNT_0005307613 /DNA_START=54 /DNA_END=1364 /DNA_ORIENTATION=+
MATLKECYIHKKMRTCASLIADFNGFMKCAPGMECKVGGANENAGKNICSVHGKLRSVDSLVADGWGGMCCAPSAQCKTGGVTSVKKRTLCRFWQEGRCMQGTNCSFAHGEDEIGQQTQDGGMGCAGADIPMGAPMGAPMNAPMGALANSSTGPMGGDDGCNGCAALGDANGCGPGGCSGGPCGAGAKGCGKFGKASMGALDAWDSWGTWDWDGWGDWGDWGGKGMDSWGMGGMGGGWGPMGGKGMGGKGMDGKGMGCDWGGGWGPMGKGAGWGMDWGCGKGGCKGGKGGKGGKGPQALCARHNKPRGYNFLIEQPDGTYICKAGMECKLADTSEGGIKRTLCMFFAKGACTRGEFCSYAHGEEQLGKANTGGLEPAENTFQDFDWGGSTGLGGCADNAFPEMGCASLCGDATGSGGQMQATLGDQFDQGQRFAPY